MLKKILILVGVLALAALAFAGDKTYSITFSNPTAVGAAKLVPGEYKIEVKGAIVFFSDRISHKSFTTPGKLVAVEKKYDSTSTETVKDGDVTRVKAIRLGGSAERLEFD
jgi:hypothetical protein